MQEDQLSFESAAKVWSSIEASKGSTPNDATGLAALGRPGTGHAPSLDVADIQICIDAHGKAMVLACAHSCRVSAPPHFRAHESLVANKGKPKAQPQAVGLP